MEESWQIKCSSTMQATAPSVASTSSSLVLRNQMERNTSYSSYSHDPRDLRRNILGAMQGPMFPNYPSLSSQKSSHVSMGNSFLALLSGPPSALQCDFKEFPNSKLMSDSTVGGGTMPTFDGPPSVYPSEQNLQLGADSSISVSTRGVSGSNCSSNSVLPGLSGPELETAFIHQIIPGIEKARSSFSLNAELRSKVPSNAGKASSTKVQVSSMEDNSSRSPSFLSSCPRVFCLGTGGYLLISNTGLLGIVCTCHYLHMSVLKFCEHSGLFGGNAGDSVRMEGGETIALWRKLYFQNFGIRIPEDQSDWDWPEGVSATSGLVKSRTSSPNVACNFSHLVRPSEGIPRSGQILDNVILSSRHTNHNMVSKASHDKQKRNAQDGNSVPLNRSIGTFQGKMHVMADTQMTEHPLSGFSTIPKLMISGPKDGCRSTASSTEYNLKNGGSPITWPGHAMQDLRSIGQKSDFSMFKNAPNSVFVRGDSVFSNIELKLGQPYQSNNFKTPDQPPPGAHILNSFVNPSKFVLPEQMIANAGDCHQGKVELGKPLYCAAGPYGANTKREQGQLNHGNNGFEISNVNNAAILEKSSGELTQNAVVSLLSNCNPLAEIKPNNNMFNCAEQTIPHLHHYESHMAISCPSYTPWDSGNGSERQLTIAEMVSHGLSDKGKGVKLATDGPYFKKDLKSSIHKETETSSYPFVTAVQGRSCELYKMPSAASEPSEARTFSSYPVNTTLSSRTNVQADHISRRSLTSSFGSGLILPSKAVTKGLPLASSTCLLDKNLALHREEANCLHSHPLDGNLRILALRQIQELSKQQHSFSSFAMNRWEGRCDGNSHFHRTGAETSAPWKQCNEPILATSREVSEVATRSQLAGPTNTNNCCDLSKLIRGIPIHTKEIDVQGQLLSDPLQNEQLSMSQSQKNISGPSEHENCCGAPSLCFQHSCNCSVHKNCTEMNLEVNTESFTNSSKEKRGTVNGQASMKLGSKFLQNHFVLNDETHSVDQEGKSIGKLSKNIVSHTSQWKDVPTKVKGVSKVMCADTDTSDKCINSILHITHTHKEQEISNMSSESSAPAVTQLSIEVSNMDSSYADVANTRCVNNLVVDEASGIDKCCSSDDAHRSERSAEYLGDSWKISSRDSGSSLNAHHQSSRSLIDELKLMNSLTWKKSHKQIQTEMTIQDNGDPNRTSGACFSQHSSSESRLPSLSSMKKPIRKRDVYTLYNDKEDEDDCWTGSKAGAANYEIPEASTGKKHKKGWSSAFRVSLIAEQIHGGARTLKKFKSVGCTNSSFSLQTNELSCKSRPIVCGKYGELSNGEFVGDIEKPAKIVPLSKVLKSARRCALPKNGKSTLTSMRKLKNTNPGGTGEGHSGLHCLKTKKESSGHCAAAQGKTDNETSLEKATNKYFTSDCKFSEELTILKVGRHRRSKRNYQEEDNVAHGQLKSKFKEIRKRSIYELTVDRKGLEKKMSPLSETSKCIPEMEGNELRNGDDKKKDFCEVDERSPQEQTCSSLLDLDSFCCVCGSSNKDETNCLLECNGCLIRVHQACYGVSRAPKGHWYCRPCRTSSRNIVCVLCGYGGGAMTRALRSRTIAKSLLRVWNIEAQCKTKKMHFPVETLENSLSGMDCYGPGCERGASVTLSQHEKLDLDVRKMGSLDVLQNSCGSSMLKMDNSITAGCLDSTTKQWVHMVCGLWTPGTRCPNVDTMSAFDVSCAPRPRADVVCSICRRPGGSCIKCRVISCSVPFHPWCAHQKGLLQSELEGVDNENVGFYGRCLHHATLPMSESDSDPVDQKTGVSGVEEITCARTEGYKGRKRDGFWHNYYNQSKGKVGCHVPQEQLNAWIHINGQKACMAGLPKLPTSDIENDCRKEYARYKQGRGWKHLVVYKSGIHALGLYTSRFISRGEMVVEYIGEIVGQRVSDKRENEYQSGRKLQYKSACYFFRIDKEHIIDATCKGGIARFVNHSCLVVFFAERDIFPGEEITYDYHFNHEDEGKKIPCFCNSKNCRRYLN